MSRTRSFTTVVAFSFGLFAAGCGTELSSLVQSPASVTLDNTTVRVASPLPEADYAAGDEVPFAIEVFSADKSDASGHPGPGGHYHVLLDSKESVVFQSAVPSFKFSLPTTVAKGRHNFYVQYHAADGATDMIEVSVPFRVR